MRRRLGFNWQSRTFVLAAALFQSVPTLCQGSPPQITLFNPGDVMVVIDLWETVIRQPPFNNRSPEIIPDNGPYIRNKNEFMRTCVGGVDAFGDRILEVNEPLGKVNEPLGKIIVTSGGRRPDPKDTISLNGPNCKKSGSSSNNSRGVPSIDNNRTGVPSIDEYFRRDGKRLGALNNFIPQEEFGLPPKTPSIAGSNAGKGAFPGLPRNFGPNFRPELLSKANTAQFKAGIGMGALNGAMKDAGVDPRLALAGGLATSAYINYRQKVPGSFRSLGGGLVGALGSQAAVSYAGGSAEQQEAAAALGGLAGGFAGGPQAGVANGVAQVASLVGEFGYVTVKGTYQHGGEYWSNYWATGYCRSFSKCYSGR